MGLFNTLMSLTDQDSDQSLEKRLLGGIDKLEDTLNSALDKAEAGVERAEAASQKIDVATDKVSGAIDKVDEYTNKKQN